MDIILQILQLIGYLLLLVILALLWRKAFRQSEARRFWQLLALAWTMNLLGNIAWIVHDLVTGTELDTFSVIDLFYVSRYVLIGCALWLYPVLLSRRAWFWIGGTMLAASVVVWAVYFEPAMALRGGGWTDFLGLALYPVLDTGIVVLAWLRVRATRGSAWSRYAILLFCVMASYGIANTINLTEYVFSPIAGGILQHVLWVLTDVFLLVIALGADLPRQNESRMRNEE
ncbi:MAG: hypothetical protein EHM40_08525 [Chloroflexi bacterium]|nr:MAG: hypothetical protein EHM40_08525 [Chloroflexota bacterium]